MDPATLREFEGKCVQEESAACIAACPLHIDGKLMMSQTAQGNFVEAYKTYRKASAFPDLLSRICDAPCQKACRIGEISDPIQIRLIEHYLAQNVVTDASIKKLPSKHKYAAVIGSGLDGMVAAYDLQRKGYEITIFEPADECGGSLLSIPKTVLPENVIEKSFDLLKNLGVKIKTKIEVPAPRGFIKDTDGSFLINDEPFQCVFLSGSAIPVDPVSRMTEWDGVFAGNSEAVHWAETASNGRRAAVSMDRYIQHVSLTASRPVEGAYETQLFTSLEGIPSTKHLLQNDQISEADIRAEAARCIQCTCMECAKGCAFIREYKSYPKVYTRQCYNNVAIVTGLRTANTMINSCSECGQCEAVCPHHYNFQDVIDNTRQIMKKQNKMPPSAHDFALRDMAFSNSEQFALAKAPAGKTTAEYVFFPGCQLSAANYQAVEMIYDQLQTWYNGTVGLILRCCGSIAQWAGDQETFQQSRKELISEVQRLGNPEIITACSSCLRTFKKYYPELKVRSAWPIIDKMTPEIYRKIDGRTLAIHDPCAARYEKEDQDAVRSLIRKSGVTIEELPMNREKATCCTYGGNTWNANRELSHTAIDARIAQNTNDFVTYCAMCQDFYQGRGKTTYHLVDLLYSPEVVQKGEAMPKADYTMRHENRNRIKRHMLRKYWSEEMGESPSYEQIKLYISEPVRQVLNDRLILTEDIQRVLEMEQQSGFCMKNQKTGHLLTHAKPQFVTYWVEYAPKDDGYEIFTAYSHRMALEEK